MSTIISRRAALGGLGVAAALAVPAIAVGAVRTEADAEIIALGAEIVRRSAEAKLSQERIDPLHDHFVDILRDDSIPKAVRSERARTFSRQSGHEAAIDTLEHFEEATARLFKQMMAIPATTQAGRAAKVCALLVHVMRSDWRGPARDLDWDKEMARSLLGEFAGMNAAELEAI